MMSSHKTLIISSLVILFLAGIGFFVLIFKSSDPLTDEQVRDLNNSDAEDNFGVISESSDLIDTSDWKTYRNGEYGFEIKYPPEWYAEKSTSSVKFYDKHWYFIATIEERRQAGASISSRPFIHLYDVSPRRQGNWVDQAYAIRNRIGGPESSDGWYATYFKYAGIKTINEITFNVFTWVGVDGYGEFVTFHPKKKRLFGIEAQAHRDPIAISRADVRTMVESIRFLSL